MIRTAQVESNWQWGRWQAGHWALVIGLPMLILYHLIPTYLPFMSDDSFISLRYAERMLQGKGLTWNDGERVEGYSNLLWVLAVALVHSAGIEMVLASRIVCLGSTLAAGAALLFFGRRMRLDLLAVVCGLALMAMARPVVVWSIGGLEATLQMALLTWVAVLGWLRYSEDQVPCAKFLLPLLLGGAAINRPEGAVFIGIFGVLFLVLVHREPDARRLRREIAWVIGAALILPLGQLLVRLGYYGRLMPNTYYAKVAFTDTRLLGGLKYVWNALISGFLPVLLTFGILGWMGGSKRIPAKVLAYFSVPIGCWLGAVVVGGGDIFPAFRHLTPVLGLGVAVAMLLLHHAMGRRRVGALIVFVLSLAVTELIQKQSFEMMRAQDETWEWTGKELGEQLREICPPDTLVAVGASGAIPFYSKLPTLDMLGLNDDHLTKRLPQDFGHGFLGHELFDVEYVLWRRPEIIIFHVGNNDYLPAEAREHIMAQYALRWLELPSARAAIWVRTDGELIKRLAG